MGRRGGGSIGPGAILDIETESWDRYVVGGLLAADGAYREVWHDGPGGEEALVDAVLDTPGMVWSHNGGRFDFLWLLDHATRRGLTVRTVCAGARVVSATIGETTLQDSYALIPMSLRAAAGLAGASVSKGETGLPCRCGRGCGGYCSIRRGMVPAERRRLAEYLRRDCETLDAVVRAVCGVAEREGIPLRSTVGSTAWAWAREHSGIPQARWSAGVYRLARGAYYGGRCEVYRQSAAAGHRYDIRSSYPAALVRTDLPTGPARLETRGTAAYESGRPCIIGARVRVRECRVPPLPARHGGRLLFPIGEFGGVWPALELRAAAKSGDAEILRLGWAIVQPDAPAAVLREWCQHVWDLRAAAEESGATALAKWYKWLANSLTGKLGQDPAGESLALAPSAPRPCTCRRVPCRCGGWTPLDVLGRGWIRPFWRVPGCGHVTWSAHLTAAARVELAAQLREAGDGAVYCDTDSVYSLRPLARRVGADLGEWKYEGPMSAWRAIAPKTYVYRSPHGDTVRSKGIPRATLDAFNALASGAAVDASAGVRGIRSALRAGGPLFVRAEMRRRALGLDSPLCGGRARGPGGVTRAVTLSEFDALAESSEPFVPSDLEEPLDNV